MMIKKQATIPPSRVIDLVEDEFGQNIRKRSREPKVIIPRFMCMHLMRKYCGLSLNGIKLYFPITDHTTVINALRRSEDMMQTDEQYLTTLIKLDGELKAYAENKNNILQPHQRG